MAVMMATMILALMVKVMVRVMEMVMLASGGCLFVAHGGAVQYCKHSQPFGLAQLAFCYFSFGSAAC